MKEANKNREKQPSYSANSLTMNSTIGQIYHTPVGHDAIAKVLMQLGLPEVLVTNPIISGLKLKTLADLTRGKLKQGFFDTLLHLAGGEADTPLVKQGDIVPRWWKEAVFYQIYPRSFYDSNGDGVGDLRGIIQKLDYLKELGITALWLNPIYDSPDDDNGYDIRNYHAIMEQFGTMEDFEELLDQAHKRGMKLIMDLVVNHTSDEHEWFRHALKEPTSKYRDYYFFRESDTLPNNWTSFFAGPAWNYYEENNKWALHLFSKKQMDLNWDNPDVRTEVSNLVNWWLNKGVDGFRMDVINYISKENGLPNGDETIGAMMGFPGIEHYYYGPHLHEYLHELRMNSFEHFDAVSVGETPGIGMKMAQLLTGEERKELDMIFSFDHLETPGHVRFDDYKYDLNFYRDYIIDWMENYGDNCWMSLFYNNHDNPRMASKVTSNPDLVQKVQVLLAAMQLTLKGTPFLYQGDEMGLTNYEFTSIEQITDVEAKGYYKEYLEKGMSPAEAFQKIVSGTREHTRIPLPWNDACLECHKDLKQEINSEMQDIYRHLIALRQQEKALVYGEFRLLSKRKNRFIYERKLGHTSIIIDCNLGEKMCKAHPVSNDYRELFSHEKTDKKLNSYGVIIYRKNI